MSAACTKKGVWVKLFVAVNTGKYVSESCHGVQEP